MPGARLNLELVVRSVTCPGVWLCTKGCVTLSLQMFGSKFKTKPVPPTFPLHFNTTFKFTKDLGDVDGPSDLKKIFDSDQLHCKLLQWRKKPNEGNPKILATYIGAVEDLIYSPEIYTNSKVDLLMKHTPIFPGIIAPKVELERRLEVTGLDLSTFITKYDSVFYRNCKKDRNLEDFDDTQCEQYCKIDNARQDNFWMINLGHMARQRIVCHKSKQKTCDSTTSTA